MNDPGDVRARDYHYWTDAELWDLYCWSEAKRRVGNLVGKAIDYGTTASNLGLQLARARREIAEIERRLGKTQADRERAIKDILG
jgi:hypothetical protein